MFISVSALNGDTFATLARRYLGDSGKAATVAAANPGISEPIAAATRVRVPSQADILDGQAARSGLTVIIDGQVFNGFESHRFTTVLDGIDTLELLAPTTPQTLALRPMGFNPTSAFIDGELVFTGVFLTPSPLSTPVEGVVSLSFYSLPGVLVDCPPPASMFPLLESEGQALDAVAKSLSAPFGVGVSALEQPGNPFERVAIKRTQKIMPYLVQLAAPRNLILSNDARGDLIIFKSVSEGAPVGELIEGQPPLLRVSPQFNPRQYYSEVTGITPTTIDADGAASTIRNSDLPNTLRPYTFNANNAVGAELSEVVRSNYGRMLANVATYRLDVSSWYDPNGQRWQTNTTVVLTAPEAYVDTPYELLIREVSLTGTPEEQTAVLLVVIPSAFNGTVPGVLPWQR